MELPDAELVLRTRSGDKGAYGEFVARYQRDTSMASPIASWGTGATPRT